MANFSCYISIKNESSVKFENGDIHKSWGKYVSLPKSEIEPNGLTEFRLKDKTGPGGSTGYVIYRVGKGSLRFDYDCPYGSGDNVLKYKSVESELEILYYGTNDKSYLSAVPENKNGVYPRSGHPLSGVFVVRDLLSAGWDIIYSMRLRLLNQELTSLYDKNIISHHFEKSYAKIEITTAPSILGSTNNYSDDIVLSIPLKGTIDVGEMLRDFDLSEVNINGFVKITISLREINSTINKNKGQGYSISIDLENSNLFKKLDAKELFGELPTWGKLVMRKFEKKFLNLMNEYLNSLPNPLKFTFDLATPIPLDKTSLNFTYIGNKQDPNSSFLALLIGFNGKKGNLDLSLNTIYDSPDCDSSFILSNSLIMNSVKSALIGTGKLPKGVLELTSAYPYVLTNTEKIEINSVDNVWLRINKGDIKSYFNPRGQLVFKLIIKWWNVATLGAEGSTKVDLTFDFSIDDGNVNIKLGKHIDTSAPWWFYTNPVLLLLKSTVENLINTFFVDPMLQSFGDSMLSIPNFQSKNIISPSYIRVSGSRTREK